MHIHDIVFITIFFVIVIMFVEAKARQIIEHINKLKGDSE